MQGWMIHEGAFHLLAQPYEQSHGGTHKEVATLGIPDDYECMDPELIEALRARVSARLELPGVA